MKISEWKKVGKNKLALLFAAGIILIIFSYNDMGDEGKQEKNENAKEERAVDYTNAMEQKVENILESMNGISNVNVMITLKTGTEKIVKEDLESSKKQRENGTDSETEESVKKTTVVLGGDEDAPYVVKEIYPQVQGVAITGKGVSSQQKKKEIIEMMEALFNIPIHKISIMEN